MALPLPAKPKKRQKPLERMWDCYPVFLLTGTIVLEAVGLESKDPKKKAVGQTYARLTYGRQKAQTLVTATRTPDPVWREMFIFAVDEPETEIQVAVMGFNTGIGKDKYLGDSIVCFPIEVVPERINDCWFDLKRKPGKKPKPIDNRPAGTIHLRYTYSVSPETPRVFNYRTDDQSSYKFNYNDIKSKIKSGDIIAYSGIGLLPTLVKLTSNSNYSHLGLAIWLPAKYTRRERLYVLEVTRNIDRFYDGFKEMPVSGFNLFKLWDRVHQINASRIWWFPLRTPLDPAGKENMIDWIWELHSGESIFPQEIAKEPIPIEIEAFLENNEYSVNDLGFQLAEIHSAIVVINALRLGGKRLEKATDYIPPVAVVGKDFFADPVLIKETINYTNVSQPTPKTPENPYLITENQSTETNDATDGPGSPAPIPPEDQQQQPPPLPPQQQQQQQPPPLPPQQQQPSQPQPGTSPGQPKERKKLPPQPKKDGQQPGTSSKRPPEDDTTPQAGEQQGQYSYSNYYGQGVWPTHANAVADQSPQSTATRNQSPDNSKVLAQAAYSFTAEAPEELSFPKDTIISIIEKRPNGWWLAELNGARGLIPANYVKLLN